ncbi:MAG: DinB family protein [Planctomycetota bacterium]|nr:DinB family protein [Planctomycetota bacterium]
MTSQDLLADSILSSRELLERFLDGFDDGNRTKQAENLPGHVAWILGHCALTMHRVAEDCDGRPLPENDFVTGDGRAGGADRYDTESICFDSSPVGDPARYPSMARCRAIFEAACERLASTVRSASDEALEKMVPWVAGEIPFAKLVLRIAFHNGVHAGQIIDLRRGLGLDRVIKV